MTISIRILVAANMALLLIVSGPARRAYADDASGKTPVPAQSPAPASTPRPAADAPSGAPGEAPASAPASALDAAAADGQGASAPAGADAPSAAAADAPPANQPQPACKGAGQAPAVSGAEPFQYVPPADDLQPSPTPGGPSRGEQRKIDMREISDLAKKISSLIGDSAYGDIAEPAERVRELAAHMRAFYDFGMEDPESEAIPEVFQSAKVYEFRREIDQFEREAATLRDAAKEEKGVPAAASALFNRCKSCHEPFLRKKP